MEAWESFRAMPVLKQLLVALYAAQAVLWVWVAWLLVQLYKGKR